jgi:hypothetical protein
MRYILAWLIITMLFGAGHYIGGASENKRMMDCYMAKDFSGFAWIDESEYFTCSADIRKGRVKYINNKGK